MARTPQRTTVSAAALLADISFPKLQIDLETMGDKACNEALEEWRAAVKPLNVPPLNYTDGWHNVDADMQNRLLARNTHNRPVTWPQVKYYADQMAAGEWQKTGQPIIINKHGDTDDGQHRAIAGLLSGVAFPSYLVVTELDNAFAWIDGGKTRTHADALRTAGCNGVSPKIAAAITVLDAYLRGAYLPGGRKAKTPKLSAAQALRYNEEHPDLRIAVRQMAASDRVDIVNLVNNHGGLGFVAYMIFHYHGETVLDEFVEAVQDPEGAADNAATLLRKVLEKNNAVEIPKKRMKKAQVLAHLIKAFNLWLAGDPQKRLTFAVNEAFPEFDTGEGPNADDNAEDPAEGSDPGSDDAAEEAADYQAAGHGENITPAAQHRQGVRAATLASKV